MTQDKLGNILSSVAKRMRADFEQSQNFNHNGEAGTSRELLIQEFLSGYLPTHVEAVHNVEVISTNGDVSPQSDIVLIDRGTPPFTSLKGFRIIPNECVYGMVEVKTKLDGNQLTDACNKISKMRTMPKTAYRPITGTIPRSTKAYGQVHNYFPTSGMIVGFDSLKLETIGNHLIDWCRTRNPYEWPDSVWVAGKGHLQWGDARTGSLFRSPVAGASLFQIDADPEQDILLPLALHLNVHFSDAWMNPLDLNPYSGTTPLGHIARNWTF
ncbi:DUF6602 domain-containing protein [Streptomyces noursei]|uniref:DUF6602 domain-containing protein n=1 Tax=Streptomyces noursei TaxID=1971 RepID=A0A401R281_STRNR|nr:DUF6602 domain-containing protein [Streptomyces noursei]UWS72788.1 hypothetical protein N1H47_16960 [Streptomyces noursei]GCB91758.1 hypothetical protein SALB_04498 [Streptomyces noursei]